MLLDIIALMLLATLVWAGMRLGLRVSGLATLGLVVLVIGLIVLYSRDLVPAGTRVPILLGVLLLWVLCLLGLWRFRPGGQQRSWSGALLGSVQTIVVVLLLAGTLGTLVPPPTIASARVYPPLAAIGGSLVSALPETPLAYPAPVRPETATEPAPDARPIDWAEAQPFVDSPVRRLTGTVRAADRAPLGFEVDGRVASVLANIGESFAKGDVLATLETTSLRIALHQARAALFEAEAMETEAELDFRRQQTLFERDVVSEAARDRARASFDSAKSRLAVSQARVADAQESFGDAELIAPYDGQVAARLIEPAQLYRPGNQPSRYKAAPAGTRSKSPSRKPSSPALPWVPSIQHPCWMGQARSCRPNCTKSDRAPTSAADFRLCLPSTMPPRRSGRGWRRRLRCGSIPPVTPTAIQSPFRCPPFPSGMAMPARSLSMTVQAPRFCAAPSHWPGSRATWL